MCGLLKVMSNIISVHILQVDRDEKTWLFSNKVMVAVCNGEAHQSVIAFLCSSVSPSEQNAVLTLLFISLILLITLVVV